MSKVPLEPPVTTSTGNPRFSNSARVFMSAPIHRRDARRRFSQPTT
jgi:hypothetical protein